MRSIKKLSLPMIIAALMVVMAACGGGASTNNTQSTTKTNSTNTNTAAPKQEVSGSLVLSGSTALQPLAAAAAEQFMNENPKASIQVNGGGSGTGLSQVSQGAVQVGNSDVFAEEKKMPAGLVDHQVAVVGMTAVVNPKLGIKNISKSDLIKVFTGKVTNWSALGGPNQKIVLVNRSSSSGTRFVFDKYALGGATPAQGITQDASNTVKKIVSETPGAIGYLAFSYLNDNTVTPLSIDGVAPTAENVQSGTFPVWAYEHMYTKGDATGIAKTFIDYMMSDAVQSTLVVKEGYLPVNKMQVVRDAKGNVTKK